MAGTYPSLTTIRPARYDELEPEYMGSKTEYPDGGADSRLSADSPIRRWAISYPKATPAEAADFRTLAASNFYNKREGSLDSFTFTPRGESVLSGVKFDEGGLEIREAGNTNKVYSITVLLIRRP